MVNGIADLETSSQLRALNRRDVQTPGHPASPAAQIDDFGHPAHGLFKQAQAGVHRLDAEHGRTPDVRSDQLAAALVVAARKSGMERIDDVLLGREARDVFVMQGTPDSARMRLAKVPTVEALNTPIAQSTQVLEELTRHQAPQQALDPPAQPLRRTGPVMSM